MTTAAMVLGVVPLIMSAGAGAASRFNMGLVIASGLAIGTLFTLFVLPGVYSRLRRDMCGGQRRRVRWNLRLNEVEGVPCNDRTARVRRPSSWWVHGVESICKIC
jgi:hypothetical protein